MMSLLHTFIPASVIQLLAIVMFITLALGHTEHKSEYRLAADCLTQGPQCLNDAGSCIPGYKVHHQSTSCVQSGCSYCLTHHWNDTQCMSWNSVMWCAGNRSLVSTGEAAARCISLGTECGGWIAHHSRHCGYGIPHGRQSMECKQSACTHCTRVLDDENVPKPRMECDYAALQYCENKTELLKKPNLPVHHHNFVSDCTHHSEFTRVVINLKDTPVESEWTRTTDGMNGLEWRANDSRIWPSLTGRGELCYYVKFEQQGTYFLTAQTRAQGTKQHNDMFMRFSGGLDFYHAKIMRPFPFPIRARNSYFKVYQNVGVDRVTKVLSTIDGTPHILVTKHVESTRKYHVCISGRSSKLSVYRIFFIRCIGRNCARTSQFIKDQLANNTATPCLSY